MKEDGKREFVIHKASLKINNFAIGNSEREPIWLHSIKSRFHMQYRMPHEFIGLKILPISNIFRLLEAIVISHEGGQFLY
uniref:Ovule protein n=1 Tax=Loa loa TaxID=7209 RepID=A0A1I7VPC6_LOALO